MILKIRKSFLFIYTSIMLCTGHAAAETFPRETQAIVQDEEKVMDASQVKQLSEIVAKLPEKYKLVIIPGTEELTTKDFAKELFGEYEMGQDEMLLVFNMDKQELAVQAGTFFKGKGLSDEMIQQSIDHIFVPYAKQKSYMTGLSTIVQQFSDTIQNGGNSSTVTDNASQPEEQKKDEGSSLGYMILLAVAAVAAMGIYGFLQRRKLNREMDEIELWMDSIEDKLRQLKAQPNAGAKSKGDPISSLIEKLRKDSLPAAEFSLLEAEAMCDRLRFKKAAYHIQQTKDLLAHTDQSISQLQSRLFQTKVTEDECTHILEEIDKSRILLQKKLDEARLQYGIAFFEFRDELQEINQWVEGLPEDIEDPYEFLDQLKEKKQVLLNQLKEVEGFPKLKQEIAATLDREIQQLKDGMEEMIYRGYRIPKEHVSSHVEEIQNDVGNLRDLLEEGKIQGLSEKVEEVKEQIESIYDLMEEIVTKKAMVLHYIEEIPQWLSSFDQERKQLKEELEELSLRYRVQEGAIFNYYMELHNVCEEVPDQLFLMNQMQPENDLEFIQSADTLESIYKKMESLLKIKEEAYIELEELRKGEFEARDILHALQAEITRIEQQFRRQNLPGIPETLQDMIAEARKSLMEIEISLSEVPLELQRINNLVKEAQESNQNLINYSEQIFQFSNKAEEIIRQTNRYRSQIREVNDLLLEAENAFHHADYEQAYRLAGQAQEIALHQDQGLSRLPFRKKKA